MPAETEARSGVPGEPLGGARRGGRTSCSPNATARATPEGTGRSASAPRPATASASTTAAAAAIPPLSALPPPPLPPDSPVSTRTQDPPPTRLHPLCWPSSITKYVGWPDSMPFKTRTRHVPDTYQTWTVPDMDRTRHGPYQTWTVRGGLPCLGGVEELSRAERAGASVPRRLVRGLTRVALLHHKPSLSWPRGIGDVRDLAVTRWDNMSLPASAQAPVM